MTLEETIADLNDIINKTIILKEKVINDDGKKVCDDFIKKYSQIVGWLKELKKYKAGLK